MMSGAYSDLSDTFFIWDSRDIPVCSPILIVYPFAIARPVSELTFAI